jgi:LPXTG-site transpeptidase (sortase) family protein
MLKKVVFSSYILVSLFLLLSIGYDYFLKEGNFGPRLRAKGTSVLGSDTEYSAFGEIKETYYRPISLLIESAGLRSDIIEVGLEEDGTLAAPGDWYVAGWYEKSAMPGQNGNMVLDGHFDTSSGSPAAFYQLKNVQKGDNVVVYDEAGRSYTYLVVETLYVDVDDPSRLKIFESSKDKPIITLITCSGVWLSGDLTYSKRLIVKGELIG